MSVNVAHMAAPLPLSRKWALPWHLYRGLLRFSATGPVLPTEIPLPAWVSGVAESDACAAAARVAGPPVGRFKAARYAAPASFSSAMFTGHVHRTYSLDTRTGYPFEAFSPGQLPFAIWFLFVLYGISQPAT